MLHFVVDGADVVEAPGQDEVDELDAGSVFEIDEFILLDDCEDVVEDELCFEAFKMHFPHPLIEFVFFVADLSFLLVGLDLCQSDDVVGSLFGLLFFFDYLLERDLGFIGLSLVVLNLLV